MKSIFTKYYGEYSLRYWVRLLLKKDIVLPEFQRPFVWEQEKVNSFISSLKTNHFVPPVVIGNYFDENKSRNYILDGQQRLCSLLFAYLELYPIVNCFKVEYGSEIPTSEEEESAGDEEVLDANRVLGYIQLKYHTFFSDKGLNKTVKKDDLIAEIKKEKKFRHNSFISFENSNSNKDAKTDDFFDNNYIPFIYIKPLQNEIDAEFLKDEKEYYARLFYNINAKATPLYAKQSREAIIWFIGGEVKNFLSTDITITIAGNKEKKDIQYYLAILSYVHNKLYGKTDSKENIENAVSELLKNKSSRLGREQFVVDFIDNINSNDNVDLFGDFNAIFKDLKKAKLILDNCLSDISHIKYQNIAEFEMYFFGAVYWKLFRNKDLNIHDKEIKIKEYIDELYKDGGTNKKEEYVKNINTLKRIRERVIDSIIKYSDIEG